MTRMTFIAAALMLGGLAGCATQPTQPITCPTPVSSALEDTTHVVLGISIGQPLSMGECPKTPIGSSLIYGYSPELCWRSKRPVAACSVPADEWVAVKIPVNASPVWVRDNEAAVRVANGRVEGIRLWTYGYDAQSLTMDGLTKKFGQPTPSGPHEAQNRLGAKFEAQTAIWHVDDLLVVYSGVSTDLNHGSVEITTPAGAEILKGDDAKLQKMFEKQL